ncbi:hypothetical protein [Nocardia sp. CDC160]|uniref:hypothetical protein n=1 Tax=Nocardia sp. CDC160 TaxID=3112166 RepID=UPI002DBD12E8|nr:hypothetical protein [Nocardia sp. CDC160]MEC3915629.1 hypothetical protein [Nocardia sp. CDC160]
MTDMMTRAQLTILAQTLGADPADLAFLERLGAHDIRALGEALSDALFDSLAPTFARLSKLAPLVPNALVITVAQKAIPPEVGGRAGGAIGMDHPDRAPAILGGLSPTYLADAAPFVDPRVIPIFAPRLAAELLIPSANELLRRRDYLTASRFVEHATEQLVREFERGIDDDEGLIRTAALVSSTDRLTDIFRVVTPARRERIAATALAGSPDTVLALLSVLARVDSDIAAPLCNQVFGGADVARTLEIATTRGASTEFLDIVDHLTDETLAAVVDSSYFTDEARLGVLEQAATTDQRRRAWRRLAHATSPAPPTATSAAG